MNARLGALLSLAIGFGAASAAFAAPNISAITLERTACYGTCPVYKVTLQSDGTVAYLGTQFVKVLGKRSHRISLNRFRQLARAIQRMNFFALESEYSHKTNADGSIGTVTDLPSRITTVEAGDQRKTVRNYYGGPETLTRLEDLIDQIANSAVWVKGKS
jgi:hypothetical protein